MYDVEITIKRATYEITVNKIELDKFINVVTKETSLMYTLLGVKDDYLMFRPKEVEFVSVNPTESDLPNDLGFIK